MDFGELLRTLIAGIIMVPVGATIFIIGAFTLAYVWLIILLVLIIVLVVKAVS
ncbi:hypothetical protein [Methanobacterium congolense]|uniref:Region of a membrane-bound protein predicted to be embedded in the membrane n=1 Tax=Methanobacterium congolense TaxID=118062 RepID=A0A1D3L2B4_9EURY|nr:hypothetical protein [Methanobacterium congolense]SCG85600.1 Region of a membrane-bound protein predicted to be embedded in the membrane [Methanobacterium congolense]